MRNDWRGLGLWNFYFIAKLMLYWTGFLNFHAFYNLVFASVLLMPLPPPWLHRVRHVVALPAGVALLYYESWLPPFRRLLEQPEVLQFSGIYLLELLNRFINWNMVGAGVLLLVACLFLSQWIRITVVSVAALVVVALPDQPGLRQMLWNPQAENTTRIDVHAHSAHDASALANGAPGVSVKTVAETLHQTLAEFYAAEASRTTEFSASPQSDQAFDIVFMNVCSVSWSDLASVQLDQHPLLKGMDLIFDEFNSATSYSGPAVRRLLRASCGQSSHEDLYEDAPAHCYLFRNLQDMGFQTDALLNHNGHFQDFVSDITLSDSLPEPSLPDRLQPRWTAFDGSPIWGDYDTLNQWWQGRQQHEAVPHALLYNSITLHDGNREATADGGGRSSPYKARGQAVLDDLNAFMSQLDHSGRRVVVVFIPEHGASLEGDRMQIAGMREIPTPDITHVPVGVKVFGRNAQTGTDVWRVSGPSSYLALSELLARMLRYPLFGEGPVDWAALTEDLPQTMAVSENSGTVLMSHDSVPYVRLGDRDWVQYRR